MIVAGVDVGSISTKVAVLTPEKISYRMAPTGWSPRESGFDTYRGLLEELGHSEDEVDFVVGTGYGRISLPFVSKALTEITCHARGAAHLVTDSTMVIDIGGQDSKIIKIDKNGKVLDFVMNDKCAAGTGRFLQVIAAALGADVTELSELARGKTPLPLNSMCAVFAESEVIGLLAAGRDKGEIVAGLHQAIARRITSMAQRLGKAARITFTGGVARNQGLCESLRAALGAEIIVPEECQLAGALGAALLARDYLA